MRIIETDADILEGLAHLKKRDRKRAPVIERVGTVPLRRHKPGFAGLCDIVKFIIDRVRQAGQTNYAANDQNRADQYNL